VFSPLAHTKDARFFLNCVDPITSFWPGGWAHHKEKDSVYPTIFEGGPDLVIAAENTQLTWWLSTLQYQYPDCV
jgi:hypothetical protein